MEPDGSALSILHFNGEGGLGLSWHSRVLCLSNKRSTASSCIAQTCMCWTRGRRSRWAAPPASQPSERGWGGRLVLCLCSPMGNCWGHLGRSSCLAAVRGAGYCLQQREEQAAAAQARPWQGGKRAPLLRRLKEFADRKPLLLFSGGTPACLRGVCPGCRGRALAVELQGALASLQPSPAAPAVDCFNPSMLSTFTKGKQMVDVLNALGVRAACVGNHGAAGVRHDAAGGPMCTLPDLHTGKRFG